MHDPVSEVVVGITFALPLSKPTDGNVQLFELYFTFFILPFSVRTKVFVK